MLLYRNLKNDSLKAKEKTEDKRKLILFADFLIVNLPLICQRKHKMTIKWLWYRTEDYMKRYPILEKVLSSLYYKNE